jgi:DNA-binding MarR family transcriptional regulator
VTDQETNAENESDIPEPSFIDKLIHEPSRLIIMAHLYTVENADLIFFKRKTNISWGNLSAHASKLENAGYIEIKKEFRLKKPVTILEITDKGREDFKKYKNIMKNVFKE